VLPTTLLLALKHLDLSAMTAAKTVVRAVRKRV
jgi:hypothetical protein